MQESLQPREPTYCFDFSFFSLPTYNDCLDSFPQTRIQRLPSLLLCISFPPLCEMLYFGATYALIFSLEFLRQRTRCKRRLSRHLSLGCPSPSLNRRRSFLKITENIRSRQPDTSYRVFRISDRNPWPDCPVFPRATPGSTLRCSDKRDKDDLGRPIRWKLAFKSNSGVLASWGLNLKQASAPFYQSTRKGGPMFLFASNGFDVKFSHINDQAGFYRIWCNTTSIIFPESGISFVVIRHRVDFKKGQRISNTKWLSHQMQIANFNQQFKNFITTFDPLL